MDKRCDGCSAAAVDTVTLPSGKKLDLCGHHLREYNQTLKAPVGTAQ